jgi:hypothetical protein
LREVEDRHDSFSLHIHFPLEPPYWNLKLTGGVALAKEPDLVIPDDQVGLVVADLLFVLAVDAVVLEQIRSILGGQKRVIDRDDAGVRVVEGGARHKAADAPKAVDAELHNHGVACLLGKGGVCAKSGRRMGSAEKGERRSVMCVKKASPSIDDAAKRSRCESKSIPVTFGGGG